MKKLNKSFHQGFSSHHSILSIPSNFSTFLLPICAPIFIGNATTREQLVLFTHQFENRNDPELVIRRWRIGHNGWRQLLANFEIENLEQKIMLDLRKVNEYDH